MLEVRVANLLEPVPPPLVVSGHPLRSGPTCIGWVGTPRRAFTTLNQFFPFYDRVMDTDVDAFRPFAHASTCPKISGTSTGS